jgi:hypothetical protein
MITRHILSTAIWHTPVQVDGLLAVIRDFSNPAVTINAIMAAVNCPKPCMAKTAFIMAPLHFVLANSEVMTEDKG